MIALATQLQSAYSNCFSTSTQASPALIERLRLDLGLLSSPNTLIFGAYAFGFARTQALPGGVSGHRLLNRGVEFNGQTGDHGWGIAAQMALPDGTEMMLYQPRHATAPSGSALLPSSD